MTASQNTSQCTPAESRRRILITAGPTHEPIDAVRFIGNRSSGRVGSALADEAARRGWDVTLLLGPASILPTFSTVRVIRFRTVSDLQQLLREHVPAADVLVMAAAVADYRPKVDPAFFGGKFRRKSENLMLELEPTPDLLAQVASGRRSDQLMVGFALEPRDEVLESARAKLVRKKIDMVVGNPLETMDAETIEATVLTTDGGEYKTPGTMTKPQFAPWLLTLIEAQAAARQSRTA
ncbi:MAG: hypothetical protein JSR77_16850 [Planctomycetes bacterium]|nr:hypothetical protein [Planctomycetota bacterium]